MKSLDLSRSAQSLRERPANVRMGSNRRGCSPAENAQRIPLTCIRLAIFSDHNLLLTALIKAVTGEHDFCVSDKLHQETRALPDWDFGEADVVVVAAVGHDNQLHRHLPAFMARHSEAKILLIANSLNAHVARTAIAMGVGGYLTASARLENVFEAARRLFAGQEYVDERVREALIFQSGEIPLDRLSPREQELLIYFAEGWRNKDVAAALKLSTKTISTLRMRLENKLGIDDPVSLSKFARANLFF